MFPVLKTMDDCRMNCGADSRKASNTPLSNASFFNLKTKVEFSGKDVSINKIPTKILKFLKNKIIQAALVICGFAIRGFDYSRTKKQGKTADNKEKTQI